MEKAAVPRRRLHLLEDVDLQLEEQHAGEKDQQTPADFGPRPGKLAGSGAKRSPQPPKDNKEENDRRDNATEDKCPYFDLPPHKGDFEIRMPSEKNVEQRDSAQEHDQHDCVRDQAARIDRAVTEKVERAFREQIVRVIPNMLE